MHSSVPCPVAKEYKRAQSAAKTEQNLRPYLVTNSTNQHQYKLVTQEFDARKRHFQVNRCFPRERQWRIVEETNNNYYGSFSDLKEATSSETKTEEEEEEDEDEEDEEAEEHLKHSIQRPYPPSVPLSGPMPGPMSGPFAATAEKLVGSNLVNPSHPIGAT